MRQWIPRARNGVRTVGTLYEDVKNTVAFVLLVLGMCAMAVRGFDAGAAWTFYGMCLLPAVMFGAGFLTSATVARSHRPGDPFGYECCNTEFLLDIDRSDPRRMTQTTTKTIRAVAERVHIVENRYHWTGEGRESLPHAPVAGQHVFSLDPVHRRDDYRVYYVFLERPVLRGETRLVRTTQVFEDTRGIMQPRLTKVARESTGSLTLTVRLARDHRVAGLGARACESRNVGGEWVPLRTEQLTFTEDGVVGHTWSPIVHGHRYEIAWEWEAYPALPGTVDLRSPRLGARDDTRTRGRGVRANRLTTRATRGRVPGEDHGPTTPGS